MKKATIERNLSEARERATTAHALLREALVTYVSRPRPPVKKG
jgi:hypothetical protein